MNIGYIIAMGFFMQSAGQTAGHEPGAGVAFICALVAAVAGQLIQIFQGLK